MKRIFSTVLILSILIALLSGCGRKEKKGEHGGTIVKAAGYSFEPVFSNFGVEIYVSRGSKPVPIEGVVGSATVEQEGKPPRWADLRAEVERLLVPYAFPTIAGYSANVRFNIKGLEEDREKTVEFAAPFRMTVLYGYSCPKHPEITTLRRGKCVKCGGADKVETKVRFQCSVHDDVWSMTYGECEQCGTTLVLRPVPEP